MGKVKIIIDNDAGTDDAIAILMVLEAHRRGEVDVLALTTTSGNAPVHDVNRNVLQLLEIAGMSEIPVFPGSEDTLNGIEKDIEVARDGFYYHGVDGFGDVSHEIPLPQRSVQKESAPSAILRLVRENEGEVILLAIGPLTNIAKVIHMEPNFTKMLKDLYIMGGNTSGIGNITRCAEFNFFYDPESAKIVLDNTRIPIKLVPYELCADEGTFTRAERRTFGLIDTKVTKLLNRIEEYIFCHTPIGWQTYDQLAAAWMLHDHAPKSSSNPLCSYKEYSATVELGGKYTRGQMVVEKRDWIQDNPYKNVTIMEKLNKEVYVQYLLMGFTYGVDEDKY